MGFLLRRLVRLKGGGYHRAFEDATHDPGAAQAALLADILKQNRAADYGREHGFSKLRSGQAFAREVPVVTFDDLSPYVDRMKAGEHRVLTAHDPVMFNVTSGTTDAPKYVPLTKPGLRCTASRSREWLYRALQDHPQFLDRATLCIAGASVEGVTAGGVPYGSASGMMYESLPGALHRSFALPFSVSRIRDHELRYYVMCRMAFARDVSFVVTPNPGTLVRFAETGIRYQERIVRSIRDGVLRRDLPFDPDAADARILAQLDARLTPNRVRSGALDDVMRRHGKLLPSACWPGLKLLGCWLGSTIGLQTPKLNAFFDPGVPRRDIGLLASEGCITIPCEDHTSSGILALHNNYYEFAPMGEDGPTDQHPLGCHELSVGQQYRIILTNHNGLYRYDLDDIIEVKGFYNQTPVITFVRKGDEILNITGEKLHVNHVMRALQMLKADNAVSTFRVVPNYGDLRYELMLQLEGDHDDEWLRKQALPRLDGILCDINIEYRAKRSSGRLNAPVLHVMDRGWTEDDRVQAVKAGQREAQYKWRTMVGTMSELDTRHIQETMQVSHD
jgi:hypothetical protein